MPGQRHLIECHCILPLYKNKSPVMYHKFPVYSMFNEKTGKVLPKYANCNNCGITHYVYEICKSEIKIGKEDVDVIRSIDDIKLSMPEKFVKVLESVSATIDVYEEVEDVIESSAYPSNVVLSREIIDEDYYYKILQIERENKFKIQSEIINTTLLS